MTVAQKVQIGAADAGTRDLDDGIRRCADARFGHVGDLDRAGSRIDDCSHDLARRFQLADALPDALGGSSQVPELPFAERELDDLGQTAPTEADGQSDIA